MKAMKKLLAIVLSVFMMAAMATTAMAADTTYTITMTTTAGHSYTAYQVFKGDLSEKNGTKTLSNIEWGDGVDGDALLKALKADSTYAAKFTDCTTAADVAEVLGTYADKGADIKALAKIIAANKKGNGATGTDKIEGLAAGYYLILDSTEKMPEGQTYSDFMLEVVSDVEVTAKDGTTTSEKKVKDTNDSKADSTTGWQDSADYDIGDDVPFQLKATVASDYDNYNTYELTFHDKESAGLTFNNDAKVFVDGTKIQKGFEVKTTGLTDDCTFEVVFSNLKDVEAVKAGSEITVEYTSKLNDKAVIGSTGNPNEMYVEYSNNPNSDQKGKTKEDKVIVFTFKVVVNKVDENKKPLVGASFKLSKKNTAGEYKEISTIDGTNLSKFEWTGLDDGDYKLEETVTPAGYNSIDPIEFTITAEHDVTADAPTLTKLDGGNMFTGDVSTATLTGDVVNQKGSVLPSTGGMGTTLFYVLGSIMVIGAGVVLIAKRRVDAK